MTENEITETLKIHICFLKDNWKLYPDKKVLDALRESIEKIRELEQYRKIGTIGDFRKRTNILNEVETDNLSKIIDEWILYHKIGTVEECQKTMEKQKPKKPTDIFGTHRGIFCPTCREKNDEYINNYCKYCGQYLACK